MEEALDLSFDRLRMMMMISKHDMTYNVTQENWVTLQLNGTHHHLMYADYNVGNKNVNAIKKE